MILIHLVTGRGLTQLRRRSITSLNKVVFTPRRSITSLNKVIFTSSCESSGREGIVRSIDTNNLELKLAKHTDHGGDGDGTNPEELFAAGYSSCFNGALQFQAAQHKIKCGPSLTTAAVSFGTTDTGVGLSVKLSVLVEGVQPAVAFQLADLAHAFCPYSKAIDGNIEVTLDSKAVPTGTL